MARKRKRKSKPTTRRRSQKQALKDRYAHAREDAQLAGLIPTTPEEALKPEAVSPSMQSEQPLPQLTAKALRHGWAVPEERKPDLVDELIRILDDPDVPQKTKVAAFNALRQADQAQYERDHPEEAGKAKASRVAVINKVQIDNIANDIDRILRERPGRLAQEAVQEDGNGEPVDEAQSTDAKTKLETGRLLDDD